MIGIFNTCLKNNKKSDRNWYKYPKTSDLELTENKKSILPEYVDKNGDKYGEKILIRYHWYADLLDEDSETVKDLVLSDNQS